MTRIEKTILKVLTDKWQTAPEIQSQVALKMGIDRRYRTNDYQIPSCRRCWESAWRR